MALSREVEQILGQMEHSREPFSGMNEGLSEKEFYGLAKESQVRMKVAENAIYALGSATEEEQDAIRNKHNDMADELNPKLRKWVRTNIQYPDYVSEDDRESLTDVFLEKYTIHHI